MKLFIAEKPSLGKAIAQYLPSPHKTGNGCIECDGGKQVVTWAFGHLFEQAEPDHYTPDDVPTTPKGKKNGAGMNCPSFRASGCWPPRTTPRRRSRSSATC